MVEHESEGQSKHPWETAEFSVVKTQLEDLNFLVTNGYYWIITLEKFSAIHPLRVQIAQFFARGKLAKSFLSDRNETLDSSLRETLGIVATNLLKEREASLAEQLGEVSGEIDEELIAREIEFEQANQRLHWLSQFIEWGFDEQVSVERFPELQMLASDRLNSLRLKASLNDIEQLKGLKEGLPDDLKAGMIGFMKDATGSVLSGSVFDKKLEEADKRAQKYLKALSESGSE